MFFGIDVGKGEHHAVGLDASGARLFDKALPNDETRLRAVFADLSAHRPVLVVVDQPNTIGALPVTFARSCGHDVAYLPGLSMRRIADLYPGQAKPMHVMPSSSPIPPARCRTRCAGSTSATRFHRTRGTRRVRRRPCRRGHPDQQPHPRTAHRDPPALERVLGPKIGRDVLAQARGYKPTDTTTEHAAEAAPVLTT